MTLEYETTIAGLPPEYNQDLPSFNLAGKKSMVVLDDDPTGCQTVSNIPVLTCWDVKIIKRLFVAKTPLFFILRKVNPVIKGEDAANIMFRFENGTIGYWDANRYNEPNYPSPRYTFGEFLAEGTGGFIRLYGDARITVQALGKPEKQHDYKHENVEFSGDCVYFTQRHFIQKLISGAAFEPNGENYVKSLMVQETVYASASENRVVKI